MLRTRSGHSLHYERIRGSLVQICHHDLILYFTNTAQNLRLYCRKLGSTNGAFHFDVHPLRQTLAMKNMIARRQHVLLSVTDIDRVVTDTALQGRCHNCGSRCQCRSRLFDCHHHATTLLMLQSTALVAVPCRFGCLVSTGGRRGRRRNSFPRGPTGSFRRIFSL